MPTLAWPLLAAWTVLIVYASLYPFSGWRSTGVPWTTFITAPLPHYWTWFDVLTNVAGYVPFGVLLVLGLAARNPGTVWRWVLPAALAGASLSFGMESIQNWLPTRVASNLDWLLNSLGALLGAVAAGAALRSGWVHRWIDTRQRWFAPDSGTTLVLMLLWPVALLYPLPVPYGLGQVQERIENALAEVVAGTPWESWVPLRAIEFQPMLPTAETAVVALGLLAPCLLLGAAMPARRWRPVVCLGCVAVSVLAIALSAALNFGPDQSWFWLWASVRTGLAAGTAAAVCLCLLPRSAALALAAVAWALQLYLLNTASVSVYYDLAMAGWDQGRFIHFFGLTRWLGWLWPYAAALEALRRLVRRTVAAPGRAG